MKPSGAALTCVCLVLALASLAGCASAQATRPREVSVLSEELRGDREMARLAPPPDEMEMQIHPSRRSADDDASTVRKERAVLVDRVAPEKIEKPAMRDLSAIGAE